MFYSDTIMHKIYIDEGSFDFTYQLPQMFYSLIISSLLKSILNNLGLYEQKIILFKNNKNIPLGKTLLIIRCKFVMFLIINFVFLLFFWIYLGCFCAVYKNTQIHLLLEVVSSFGISFINPFFECLLPCILRIKSLRSKAKRPLMFRISKLLQFI